MVYTSIPDRDYTAGGGSHFKAFPVAMATHGRKHLWISSWIYDGLL